MSRLKGDYMGFSYGVTQADGSEKLVHSSDLGIVRVSDGSRFNENLLPTMKDKTVQVPGGDGTYYFGSQYTQRQFNVSFAFDDLTEAQIVEIKRVFGDKQIHDLIFDETPYKVWSAKVTGNATIKYIPFDEGATNRLYKGEGAIQFTCYYPFARCWSTKKEKYAKHRAYQHYNNQGNLITDDNWEDRVNEWWAASRINEGGNFGDISSPFLVKLGKSLGAESDMGLEGRLSFDDEYISWKIPSGLPIITLNTKTGLAQDENGQIYNTYFEGNMTLKIPAGEKVTSSNNLDKLTFNRYYF